MFYDCELFSCKVIFRHFYVAQIIRPNPMLSRFVGILQKIKTKCNSPVSLTLQQKHRQQTVIICTRTNVNNITTEIELFMNSSDKKQR